MLQEVNTIDSQSARPRVERLAGAYLRNQDFDGLPSQSLLTAFFALSFEVEETSSSGS